MAFIVKDRSRRLLQNLPQKLGLLGFLSRRWICVGIGWRFGLLGGMPLAMSVEQLFQTDLSVDLSGVELGVAEDGLNSSNVCPSVVHKRGHGVTEDVTGSRFSNVGSRDVSTPILGK